MSKSLENPNLDGLLDLACRDGVDIRPTLLRVLTDLYVQKPAHSADETAQYVELAMGLVEIVDEKTRAAVLASLSKYSAAPAKLLHRLTGKSVRSDLPAPDTDARDELIETFFAASADDRRLILLNLDAAATAPARRRVPASSEVIRRLENAALSQNIGEFGRVLERALGIGRELAERIARDPSGEPIVVAAKAYGMQASVLQRILLFINPAIGQSVARVHELSLLFIEMTPQAAESMVEIWRKTAGQTPREPKHESMHWDDERRGARAPATPQPRRAIRPRDELTTRFRNSGR
ncbi:MAG: DUF2336 domain-containing protein [Pseudolabrys sp.]